MPTLAVSPPARSSLWLGLLSFLFSALAGVPAVVQGIRGLVAVRRHPDRYTGRGLALAGIGLGLLGTSLTGLGAWMAVEELQDRADHAY